MLEARILGPLELSADGRPVVVPGAKARRVLALLLLSRGGRVSTDRLMEELWGARPPASGRKALQMHVARLRDALAEVARDAGDLLHADAGGYRLLIATERLDVVRFEQLVDDGSAALEEGRAHNARQLLDDALSLWRGTALADVLLEDPSAVAELGRLEEMRAEAFEARADADLAMGGHPGLVADLQGLLREHPYREGLWSRLMLALLADGRRAEALEAYQQARARLVDDLGLEPGQALRRLQQSILAGEDENPGVSPLLRLNRSGPVAADTPTVEPVGGRSRASAAQHIRLPARRPNLLGRDDDVEAITQLLLRNDVRLVTVLGAGGVGKTSLAIEVAHRLARDFVDGAAVVDLAPLGDPNDVADSILQSLGGSSEAGAGARQTLLLFVATKQLLLVLDNFEHLLAASPLLVELSDTAPEVKILTTSRAALELRIEHRYTLQPLALPGSRAATVVAEAPASALFIERTIARDPRFRLTPDAADAIATVCSIVGGLPLAIELAAARTTTLTPREIARRLDHVLPTLAIGGRDVPGRQRSLRATLDWSHDLLDEHERAAFARLAVFAGGCTVDAAEEVAGATLDVTESLLAKSMLTRRTPGGSTRLVMLEPVRQYAAEQLSARADHAAVEARHSGHCFALAETARRELRGPDQLSWSRRLDLEADNLRLALVREQRANRPLAVLRLATSLEYWWRDRALSRDGRQWIRRALAAAGEDVPLAMHAEALRVVAYLSEPESDLEYALACAIKALSLYRSLGEPAGIASGLTEVAWQHRFIGDVIAARVAAAEAVTVARDADEHTLALALSARAATAEDLDEGARACAEATTLFERAGDRRGLAELWGNFGYVSFEHRRHDMASELMQRSLAIAEQLGDPHRTTYNIGNHALVVLERGDHAAAAAGLRETLARCRAYGLRRSLMEALIGLAVIAGTAGDPERAATLLGASAVVRYGQVLTPVDQRQLAIAEACAREVGGAELYETASAAGRRLTADAAIDLGLETATGYTPE